MIYQMVNRSIIVKFFLIILFNITIIFSNSVISDDSDNTSINVALDSDNDAMPDTWEISKGLNPLDANDAILDRDSDGINNINEYFQSLSSIWRPLPETTWQWQLSGTIDTTIDAAMYDIDLFDTPQATIDLLHSQGKKVICYFSAGSYENWRDDKDQFPTSLLGSILEGWPDEKWLDIAALDTLAPIMQARLDLAVIKKCDGVEPDNINGYQNSNGFSLTATDQLAYNQWLSIQAHQRGLSIGLKNDLGQISELLQYFDFSLNEQCYRYNECDLLHPFVDAGKAVFGVEYQGKAEDFCSKANAVKFSWLLKNLDLDSQRTACNNSGSIGESTTIESNPINYFKLAIDQALEIDASVSYSTRDGSAQAGQDYMSTSGTITIPAGQTYVLIPVEILADTITEADEIFSLVIRNPIGAVFPAGISEISSTHTIIDDD